MIDVLGATHDFVQEFVKPTPLHIIRGWQNRMHLPDNKHYVVLTLINAMRHGTNVHEWGQDATKFYVEFTVQIDFCGTDEQTVMQQVGCLTMYGRDAAAVDFFKKQGLTAHYAEDPRSAPFTDETAQFETRYIGELKLGYWFCNVRELDYFTRVQLRLENVDVHHPFEF